MNSIVELVPLLREQRNIIQNAPPDSKEVFGRIATQYLQHFRNVAPDEMAFVDRTRQCMHQNDPYDMSTAPEPYLTVVMPVAIHREVPEELNKSLQAIAEVDHMEASEVILYGNRPEDTEPSMDLGALVRRAREWFPGHLRYTTTSYKEPDINLVRRDGNDLVVMDGLKRGYPPDHPLLWLDADVKSISENYAKDIAERVRMQNGKGSIWRPCVRADSRHSFNGLNGEGVDDAVVLAALNELTVRAGVRKNRFAVGWMYPDEAAMAMALGTAALRWGQTREGQRMNPAESMRLIGIVALQRELLEDIAQKLAPQCTVRVPEKTARSPSGITSELFVPTYVATSGRRVVDAARSFIKKINSDPDQLNEIVSTPPQIKFKGRNRGGYGDNFYRKPPNDGPAGYLEDRTPDRLSLAIKVWMLGAEEMFPDQQSYEETFRVLSARALDRLCKMTPTKPIKRPQ